VKPKQLAFSFPEVVEVAIGRAFERGLRLLRPPVTSLLPPENKGSQLQLTLGAVWTALNIQFLTARWASNRAATLDLLQCGQDRPFRRKTA